MYTLLLAPPHGGKTRTLQEQVRQWWHEEGVPSDATLILVANSQQQRQWQQALLANQPTLSLGSLPVYTYQGYVRNLLYQVWPLIEQRLQQFYPHTTAHATPLPDLVGLEETEFLLGTLIDPFIQEHAPWLEPLKLTPRSFKRQLIRRLRLRAEQGLSREAMALGDAWLQLPKAAVLHRLEHQLDTMAYQARCLDSTKQLEMFHKLLGWYQSPEQRPKLCQAMGFTVTHLVVDDADEATPAQWAWMTWLLPQLHALAVGFDVYGGSRRGYLNATPERLWPFHTEAQAHLGRAELPLNALHCEQHARFAYVVAQYQGDTDQINTEASALPAPDFEEGTFAHAQPLGLPERLHRRLMQQPFVATATAYEALPTLTLHPETPSFAHHVDAVMTMWVQRWQAQHRQPSEAVWIVPTMDALTLAPYLLRLEQLGIPVQVLNGTQRPADATLGRTLLSMVQLLHSVAWQWPLTATELKHTVMVLLGLQQSEAATLDTFAQQLAQHHEQAVAQGLANPLPPVEVFSPEVLRFPHSRQQYRQWQAWFDEVQQQPFYDRLIALAQRWLYPLLNEGEASPAITQLVRSFQRQQGLANTLGMEPLAFERQWLLQAKYGSVADTTDSPQQVNPDALLIATPQKLIDWNLQRPLMWWLDARSAEWCRSDDAPLYNARVHHSHVLAELQATLAKAEASTPSKDSLPPLPPLPPEAHPQWQRQERAAHVIRKLAYLATESIEVFASSADAEGRAYDRTPVWEALTAEAQQTPQLAPETTPTLERATLRKDQQPILSYRQGSLAVTAVPGAGKTFVTVELLLELIESGVPPEKLVVLTYMESAARTLLNRLRAKLQPLGIRQLPRVSTIHALAFKLLTESGHAHALGLEVHHLSLANELQTEQLLQAAAVQSYPLVSTNQTHTPEQWEALVRQLVPTLKSMGGGLAVWEARASTAPRHVLAAIIEAYRCYQHQLHTHDLLDFNDLIQHAITLLETSEAVQAWVAEQVGYVLEDEAQDSSVLQERFLTLLATVGRPPDSPTNLIRVGDPNQAITASFNTSDPQSFRRFIANAQQVVRMSGSARCAKEVMKLANYGVQHLPTLSPHFTNAFDPTLMEPVFKDAQQQQPYNPPLLAPIAYIAYATRYSETHAVVAEVADWCQSHPQASKAILVRSNKQAERLCQQLQERGIAAMSFSDKATEQHHVFHALYALLKVLHDPSHPPNRLALWKQLPYTHYAHWLNDATDTTAWSDGETYLASTPLFALPPEQLPHSTDWHRIVQQLYYDVHDAQRYTLANQLPPLLIRIGYQWFQHPLERSQVVACALQAQRALHTLHREIETQLMSNPTLPFGGSLARISPLEVVLQHFAHVAFGRIRLPQFNEEALVQTTANTPSTHEAEAPAEDTLMPPVQVMTLHKAKGQEFDLVWLPYLVSSQFPDVPEKVQIDEADRLKLLLWAWHTTDTLPPQPDKRQIAELQQARIEEEARLLYVGITRAKQGLFCSSHAYEGDTPAKQGRATHPTHWAKVIDYVAQSLA
ncbi:MAG: UvrD-helicase domain-containing protein [Vampirovibrionales bacterium]